MIGSAGERNANPRTVFFWWSRTHGHTFVDRTEENFHSSAMCRGTRGVMVIVVGNGHGDTSSNPGRD